MPDYKLGFRGAYISAVEFGGRSPTVTIESVKLEAIPDEKGTMRDRWVVRFRGRDRGWVLNLTNAQLLAAMWGRNTDDWAGHAVTLHAARVKLGRDMVDGIRVAGSPELKEPLEVTVKLPRKAPAVARLVPTRKAEDAIPEPVESSS